MGKPLAIRRVRMAVSAFFGVLTVALCVLWVRSYWWRDNLNIEFSETAYAQLSSEEGMAVLLVEPRESEEPRSLIQINPWKLSDTNLEFFPFNEDLPRWMGFDAYWYAPNIWGIFVPHWFPLALTAAAAIALSAVPKIAFSVRAMLLATTLLAAVLGLGVWLVR